MPRGGGRFLRELAAHNERAWFEVNKQRYLGEVCDSLLRFVAACGPKLAKLSRHVVAGHAPPDAVRAVPDAIVAGPDRWRKVARACPLGEEQDTGKRAPRGYDPAHPCVRATPLMEFLARAVGVPW